jgi:hypothetical protein
VLGNESDNKVTRVACHPNCILRISAARQSTCRGHLGEKKKAATQGEADPCQTFNYGWTWNWMCVGDV